MAAAIGLAATAAVIAFSALIVRVYAPGIDESVRSRLSGRLASERWPFRRWGFRPCATRVCSRRPILTAYAWAAAGAIVGMVAVLGLTPRFGAAGAACGFVAAAWTAGLVGLCRLALLRVGVLSWTRSAIGFHGYGRGAKVRRPATFFQGSLFLTYLFASRLSPANWQLLALRQGAGRGVRDHYRDRWRYRLSALARHLQLRDHRAVGKSVIRCSIG